VGQFETDHYLNRTNIGFLAPKNVMKNKTGPRMVRFSRRKDKLDYCPALATAGVIASGRLSSSVSSVPDISVAERCLLNQ